ncbi:hypothetical protein SNE40_022943 [Patella caerulea]|uniref:Protein kinase domain-containing protein n=1 Tax=Patella caerulea TaxID=87958 RepID=A0AAN8G1R9_PATCE
MNFGSLNLNLSQGGILGFKLPGHFEPSEETNDEEIERDCDKGSCEDGAECTIWEGKWQCMCVSTLTKPNINGTCGATKLVDLSTNHIPDGTIHHEILKKIVHHSSKNLSSNESMSRLHDRPINYSSEWMLLQIVLPITVFLFLCFLVTVVCLKRYKTMRLRSKRGSDGVVKNNDNVQLLERMNNIQKNPTYFSASQNGENGRNLNINELPIDTLKLLVVVGEGAFGQVFRGELTDDDGVTLQNVAVKVLKDGVSHEIREDFEREVEIMGAFDHDNILRLIGVVTENVGDTPYMVFEYMVHGDLAELLRKTDRALQNHENSVVLQKTDLIDIATQVSNGMAYLTSQHFVHRDLATRNCLVGEGLVVKISDFGMSRDIYTCDYYKIGGSRMLPVRWMSPESVKYGKFTIESDVWAYGVVLWEIFSSGRQPYYGHSNEEVIQFLDAGILLQRPNDCPSTIYHVMLGCWKQDPKERMPFYKIHNYLSEYSKHVTRNMHVPIQDIDVEASHEILT